MADLLFDQHAPEAIAANARQSFQRDGAALLKGVLSTEWMTALADVAEDMKQRAMDTSAYYGGDAAGEQTTVVKDDMFLESPVMLSFLEQSPLARIAAAAMDSPSARIYEDLLIYKSTPAAAPTPWHQDEPQWPVTGSQMCSIWFSLEATTPETGALRFIAGSHRGPLYVPFVPEHQRENLARDMHFFDGGTLPNVDAAPEKFPVRLFSTEPGDVILFHPRAIHSAIGAHPDRPRRTFSIRFLGDDVRWRAKASAYHPWLHETGLADGDPIQGERFPLLWP